jgi:hypothetical protein
MALPTLVCVSGLTYDYDGISRWYCDEKVANREIRIWHFVIANGY